MDNSAVLQQQVSDACSDRGRLVIHGAASKPWVKPGVGGADLAVATHSGIVAYDPAELVVTARAGTPLVELEEVLAASGQMLAAECPQFSPDTSLGGALATGWSGSRAAYAGSLRDAVLGCRMINGLGEVLEFGGQVMKNVAGYDVSRLLSGSMGRLGVILDVSLKVLPKPAQEVTLEFQRESPAAARELVREILDAGEPLSAASFQGGDVWLRFSGSEASLQRLSLQSGGRFSESQYWQDLRCFELPFFECGADALWRVVRPLRVAADDAGLFDWGGGLCWYRDENSAVRAVDSESEGQVVHLQRGPLPAVGSVLATLQQRVALAFDPHGVFGGTAAAAAGEV